MRIHKFAQHSHILGRPMPMSIYGHFGVPLLLIPTASSDFEEHERMGMVAALAHHVEAGRVKLFSVNSINSESLSNFSIPPVERIRRQALYDRYLAEEVVPAIYHDCQSQLPIAVAGASFGAYHAANSLLRHPELFKIGICMSGVYDITSCLDGYYDDTCYAHNPVDYLRHYDPSRLAGCQLHVLCGQGPWERIHWTREFSNRLAASGIEHNFDLWGPEVAHDWPWWHRQMDMYVGRLFA
ncbi:MAG: prolyl oligopeptidase family serine peptidase [Candidatus Eremiobacteraeota bacterium]|nr:prolyl oligopeptidase family serine peptidase [Candidatus Eremiobacteraeota bacterium]